MNDSIREVTSVSWFGRIQRAFGGVIFGLLLIVAVIVGLFWNEGRAVQTERALNEGAGLVVSVESAPIDPANAGKLIHATGPVVTSETPTDPEFGISAQGIRLVRKVEMFQWVEDEDSETETQLGGGERTVTTYSYSKQWHDGSVDSSEFHEPDGHQNPPAALNGATFQVENATMGDFALSSEILSRSGNGETFAISQDQRDAIAATTGITRKLSVVDGVIQVGNDVTNPRVGDLRIAYELVPLTDISVIGQQDDKGFIPFQTQAGDALLLVDTGTHDAAAMFKSAQDGNNLLTWGIRVGGLVLLWIGFGLVLAPLGVLGDIIPFVGSIIRMGTGLIAFVLAALAGTLTIATAWFWYRPLLSVAIVAVGLVVIAAVIWFGRKRAKPAPAAAAATPA